MRMHHRGPLIQARALLRTMLLASAVSAAACRGDASTRASDSALARDLALANVVASQPESFNDAPLGEPSAPEFETPEFETPESPAKVTAPRASAPSPRPRPAPPRTTPQPQPRSLPRASEPAPAPAPAGEPAPAPGPEPAAAAGFAPGTRLALTTDTRVCTVTGRPGDKLTATLRDPVRGTGGATIPAGSLIVLEVASLEPGDPAESGRIVFRVRSLDVNSRAYPARGTGTARGDLQRSRAQVGTSSDTRRVATGAVAGAILGRVLGGDTRGAVIGAAAGGAAGAASATRGQVYEGCLPAGSPVTIVLEEGLNVTA